MTTPLRPGLVGKPLTAKQQRVWDLKSEGKTYAEIASILGVGYGTVSTQITYIRRKLGLTTDKRATAMLAPAQEHPGEIVNPEQIGNAVDQVNETMKQVGFPERIRASMLRRLKVKHDGEETAPVAASDADLIRLHREKLHLAFSYMDDKVFSEASARDLATAAAQLTEKLQLLEGKPTQIISDHERKKLHELLPLAIAEAQRRGLTIPGTVTEKTVEPA